MPSVACANARSPRARLLGAARALIP